MHWKILTYNIHHGRNADGRISLPRLAAVISAEQPDLAALQEVDRFLPRSRMRDQALVLAAHTGLHHAFAANIRWLGFMQYGNAVLSRLPLLEQRRLSLPGTGEKRGLLIVRLTREKRTVIFLCTHLGLDRSERKQQLTAIRDSITLFTE
ncbi:endonuclease/exonuclease/phosphatase family protein, partial [Desulfotomaculum copahuensis]|uniref:endonuclease/exonuclease/phosphatase family protein n=1 Tax=Desulfotomaculum copahuensis TaxID=1838280 RepID=UPI000A4FCD70